MISLDGDRLWGCYTPLVTPFKDGAIDYDGFESLIERQVAGASQGVVVTGTSGEPTSLTAAERKELFRRAVEVASGRLEVVAATGSANQAEAMDLTETAEEVGADAVLVVTPAFVKPSREGLVRHFVAVAERTDLPFLIYNIPGRAGTAVDTGVVQRVADTATNLVGMKHASPDLDLITKLLAALGDGFRIFCGLESYSYPMLALGGAGLMNAVGNVDPERVARLWRAVHDGDHGAALSLHRQLFAVNEAVFFDTNPGPIKHMLATLGVSSAEVRPPLAPLDGDTRERVNCALQTLLPVVV